MPKAHKTVKIQVGEHIVDCDRDIVDLIQTINTIPGIDTTNSCRGDFGPGYVSFEDTDSSGACVLFLKHMIDRISGAARKRSLMEEEYVAEHGLRYGTKPLSLYFTIELGQGYVMRWQPDSYPFILCAAREVADSMMLLTESPERPSMST